MFSVTSVSWISLWFSCLPRVVAVGSLCGEVLCAVTAGVTMSLDIVNTNVIASFVSSPASVSRAGSAGRFKATCDHLQPIKQLVQMPLKSHSLSSSAGIRFSIQMTTGIKAFQLNYFFVR